MSRTILAIIAALALSGCCAGEFLNRSESWRALTGVDPCRADSLVNTPGYGQAPPRADYK